jgi:hypothetical protein
MSHNSYGMQVKFSHYPHILYIASPNSTTLSCKLNWRHYVEILKGDAPLETGFYVILIKSCLCILFPKCAINAAFRTQNNILYFLGQFIYVGLYQCIIYRSFRVKRYICLTVSVVWVHTVKVAQRFECSRLTNNTASTAGITKEQKNIRRSIDLLYCLYSFWSS